MSFVHPGTVFQAAADLAPLHPSFDMKKDFFDALTIGDISRAASVFSEDGVFLSPGLRPIKGRAMVQRILGMIRRRYDHIEWQQTVPMVSSGGWLATGWTVYGTFKNTKLPYENEVLSLVKLNEQGKIAILSDYFKDTLAFQPPPAPLSPEQASHIAAT